MEQDNKSLEKMLNKWKKANAEIKKDLKKRSDRKLHISARKRKIDKPIEDKDD
jgi:hypothetical protein